MFDLDDCLTAVMNRVDELRANQSEPLGLPVDALKAHQLKDELAALMWPIQPRTWRR
jgi:hypothetical protein